MTNMAHSEVHVNPHASGGPNDRRAAALAYAAAGIPVLPLWGMHDDGTCRCGDPECDRAGKHPHGRLAPHGVKDATTVRRTIDAWFDSDPDINVGLSAAGLLIADLDGDRGADTLQALVAEHGPLPLHPISVTGGGGTHRLFRLPPGRKGRNGVKVRPGLDFRSDGGLIVAPPSRHACGKPYAWVDGLSVHDLAPPEAPPWLADLGCTPARKPRTAAPPPLRPAPNGTDPWAAAALRGEADALARMGTDSGRNAALNTAAFNLGQIAAGGRLDRATCEAALMDACERNGLWREDGERQCRATFASGFTKGFETPRHPPPPGGHADDDADNVTSIFDRMAERKRRAEERAGHGGGGGAAAPDLEDFEDFEATLPGFMAKASEIEPKPVSFLWYPYIPAEHIALIGGRGGKGKGLVCTSLAACVTTRTPWPDGTDSGEPANVLWAEAEDPYDQAIVPRLIAAGADCGRVTIVDSARFKGLDLRRYLTETATRLVVLSPMLSFLKNLGDKNDEMQVRAVLEALVAAVKDTNCAVLGIAHLNKKPDLVAIERLLGAVAFGNFVRAVTLVGPEDEEEDTYRLVHEKHNLSVRGSDLIYHPVNIGENPRGQYVKLEWSVPAENIDGAGMFNRRADPDRRQTAADWLIRYLKEHGESPREAVVVAGGLEGFTDDALEKAIYRCRKLKYRREGTFPPRTWWGIA